MPIVVRVTRHPMDSAREEYLRGIYGDDVVVITEDVRYGDDSVAAVIALFERVEMERGDRVVALEATAPFPVLLKLMERQRDLGVALIRAQFQRDEFGRNVVSGQDEGGRDIFAFSHYEELVRLEFQTRRLEKQG